MSSGLGQSQEGPGPGPDPSLDYKSRLQLHEIALRAELSRRYLYNFIKEFWSVICNDSFIDNWHIPMICNEIQIVYNRAKAKQPKEYDLVINVPPGTTKSTILTKMFPIWAWVNSPEMSFITGSYSADLSLEHADISRDIINSKKFRAFYPHLLIRQDHDVKSCYQIISHSRNRFEMKLGGKRYSTSVGGTATGLHGHIIIVDDPLNPKQAGSSTRAHIDQASKWVDETVSTRRADKVVTPLFLIMQRLHQDDPSGHLLAKKIPIRHICLPGEIDSPESADRVRPKEWIKYYKDGLLDPVRLSRVVLNELLQYLGKYGYSCQILQHVVPPGGKMFDVNKLVIIDKHPSIASIRSAIYYWDKAGTQDGGKFTAGVLLIELMPNVNGPRYVITRVKRGQWSSDIREGVIKSECLNAKDIYGHRLSIGVEQEPGSGGKESAENTKKNLDGFRVILDRPSGDKVLRADPLSVRVGQGGIALIRDDWNKAFIEEMTFFPASAFKDQIDAASGGYNILFTARRAGGW